MNIFNRPALVITLGAAIALAAVFVTASPKSQSQALAQLSQQEATTAGQSTDAMDLKPQSFVFLELFTSEGCSSCPSADENLERIAEKATADGTNIYTLSYHVDYWNRLGWTDPYSSAQHSDRQRKYAERFDSTRIYTPQMVVNGKAEFVGSNKKLSDRAVDVAMKIEPTAAVKVNARLVNGKVKVDWQTTGLDRGDTVNVALVQNKGTQSVTRGENAHRKLNHVNIVRQLQSARSANGQMEFDPPKGFDNKTFHVVGFIQSETAVTAAGKSGIAVGMAKKAKPTMSDETNKKTMTSDGSSQVLIQETSGSTQKTVRKLVPVESFLGMLRSGNLAVRGTLAQIQQNWDINYVPMMLEAGRFMPPSERALVMGTLESKTGQRFGTDFDKWLRWSWKQKFDPHPDYGKFKSGLYSKIDPRFSEYFEKTDGATIRLDEVRWGGVKRDGIPPLKNPAMITANQANYLADTDVVFGIELNGDARCYPKRILAWHEMFKDTIGGQSVAGVY